MWWFPLPGPAPCRPHGTIIRLAASMRLRRMAAQRRHNGHVGVALATFLPRAVSARPRREAESGVTLPEEGRSHARWRGGPDADRGDAGPGAGPVRHQGRAARAPTRAGPRRPGSSSVWIPQIPDDFDALTAATLVGTETSRIEIGTAVVPVQPRHPIALAQQALSTQAVCEGRLALGLGVSHHWVIDDMLGLPYERPVADPAGPPRRARPGAGRARAWSTWTTTRSDVHNPLDITDIAPTPVLHRRARPGDAAPGGGAHRRHHPLDGRRAGHRRAHRPDHHRGGRGGRAAGAARRGRRSRSASAPTDEVDAAVARTNRHPLRGRDLAELPEAARPRRRPRASATSSRPGPRR